jgi:hypothetical protein
MRSNLGKMAELKKLIYFIIDIVIQAHIQLFIQMYRYNAVVGVVNYPSVIGCFIYQYC